MLSSDVSNLTETDTAGDISTAGMLTISDVDSPATFVAQAATVGSYGTFAIDSAGAWTYTANSAHNEFEAGTTYTDTFAVASADGTTTSVTINILGTNDAAVLSADVSNLTETDTAADISTSGTLTISDVDSPATFVAQAGTAGSYGTFAIDSAGAWTYTASSAHNEFAAGTTYTDTFSVASADGTLTSVTINILGTNDTPVANGDAATVAEGGAVTTVNVLANDSDADSALTAASITAFTQGGNGSVVYNNDGTFTYTHNGSETTSDSFTYTIDDGAGGTATTAVSLTVNAPVNQAPVSVDDSGFSTSQDTALTIASSMLLANDSDPNGDPLAITEVSGATNGTVAFDSQTNVITFTPNANYTGTANFSYTVSDGTGGTATASVGLTVTTAYDQSVLELGHAGGRFQVRMPARSISGSGLRLRRLARSGASSTTRATAIPALTWGRCGPATGHCWRARHSPTKHPQAGRPSSSAIPFRSRPGPRSSSATTATATTHIRAIISLRLILMAS